MGFESTFRSCSEAYLAEDHQMSQRLFRVIVGGRHAGMPEKGKEESLLVTSEIGSEGLGGFEAKRLFADGIEFSDEPFFELGRCLPGNIAGFELLPRVAES